MWINCVPHPYGPSFLITACLLPPHMPFFLLHSSDGDTVCMTLFVVPILACLLPFWLSPTLSPTSLCPYLPTEQTFTVSHFLHQKGWERPLRTDVSNQPASFPAHAGCPSTHVPIWPLKWQETMERSESVMSWQTTHDAGYLSRDVLMSRTSGWTEWWELYDRKTNIETSAWSHKWWFKDVFNQGLQGATAESFHGSPERMHPHIQLVTYFFLNPDVSPCQVLVVCLLQSSFHFLQQEERSIRRTRFLSESVHPCIPIPIQPHCLVCKKRLS